MFKRFKQVNNKSNILIQSKNDIIILYEMLKEENSGNRAKKKKKKKKKKMCVCDSKISTIKIYKRTRS